jgi:hypothetical protein
MAVKDLASYHSNKNWMTKEKRPFEKQIERTVFA